MIGSLELPNFKVFTKKTENMLIYTLIIVLITIICILMTIAVLLQSGQGGGLSGGIAGGMGGGNNMMGSRRTADFLSKATSVLAAIFLSLCVLANFFIVDSDGTQSTIQQRGMEMPAPPPDFGTPAESPSALPAEPADSE